MKYLIVARHGHYGFRLESRDNRLTDRGRRQMESLGEALKEILNGCSVCILSSTAPRALDSSEVLRSKLGDSIQFYEEVPYFWSGSDAPEGTYYSDGSKIENIIGENKDIADVLIIMTHQRPVEEISGYFVNQPIKIIPEGGAICIDLEKGSYRIIIPQMAEVNP